LRQRFLGTNYIERLSCVSGQWITRNTATVFNLLITGQI